MRLWAPGQYRSCTNLRLVKDVGLVACGQCDNCHKGRIKDWIGRCLLEARTAHHATFATLTYGGDRLDDRYAASISGFQRDDVAAYLKRLRWFIFDEWRRAGGNADRERRYCGQHDLLEFPAIKPRLRLFWSGELGPAKGRPHYHLLLFWQGCKGPADLPIGRFCFHGKYPDEVVGHLKLRVLKAGQLLWELRQRGAGMDWYQSDRTYWDKGMVRYEDFHGAHAYYVAGYIVKSQVATEVMRPGISRRPVLGAEQIGRFAQAYVDSLLSPQVKTYTLPRDDGFVGRRTADGRRHIEEYWLPESAARLLCREFLARWRVAHAIAPERYSVEPPKSELLDDYVAWEDAWRSEKESCGKSTVRDDLLEERRAERREPGRDIGSYAAVSGKTDDDVDRASIEMAWSTRALAQMAGSSFGETAILRRRAEKRYRKLKTGTK